MSAVDEYKAVRHDINHGGFPPFSGEQMSRIRDAADAAIAELEAEATKAVQMLRLDIASTCPFGERGPDGIETCPNCSQRLADLRSEVGATP